MSTCVDGSVKVPTLKDMKAYKKGTAIPKNCGFAMFSQHVSSFQVATPSGYYVEAANPGVRG